MRYYVWIVVLYGAETWTVKNNDVKYVSKCGCGEKCEKPVGVTNEDVLIGVQNKE